MPFYFYTETAFHHQGDYDYLLKLIDASKATGAHGVKFQVLIDLSELISSVHPQFAELEKTTFSAKEWIEILAYANEQGLDIVMMPLDRQAFDLVRSERYEVKYMDIHSVSFYDDVILRKVQESGIPVILGVGGRTLEEIDEKKAMFGDQLKVIMTGFQSFPSRLEDIKLERIRCYRDRYAEVHIGYADHSAFDSDSAIKANEYAYLLGARYFEKHITISEGEDRLDCQAALDWKKIRSSVQNLRYLDESVLAHPEETIFELNEKEQAYRSRQKVAVAKANLEKGTIIDRSHLAFKMAGTNAGYSSIKSVMGKELTEDLARDGVISKEVIKERP